MVKYKKVLYKIFDQKGQKLGVKIFKIKNVLSNYDKIHSENNAVVVGLVVDVA